MIRITSLGSPFLTANEGSRTYVSNNGPAAGMVRYNTNSQQLEAFDGGVWHAVYQDLNLDLSPFVRDLLRWAEAKRAEEQELDRLCKEYPNLDVARQEFEILRRLVGDPKPDVKDNF